MPDSDFDVAEKISDTQSKSDSVTSKGGRLAKEIVKAPVTIAANTAKNAVSKADPLNKPVSKSDVNDTGVEGMRLAKRSIKKTGSSIKTVDHTVKSTSRAVRNTKTAARNTGKAAYKTAEIAAKTTVRTVRIASSVAAHVIALVLNPISIILIAALIILVILVGGIVAMSSAQSTQVSVLRQSQTYAFGLVNVAEEYKQGVEYFKISAKKNQDAFNSMIDSMHYDYNDLPHSDLVYMERNDEESKLTKYSTNFAANGTKITLKAAWHLPISELEAVAIMYVYQEKQVNDVNGTVRAVYEVSFDQELFDKLLDECIKFNDTAYEKQQCPNKNCSAEKKENPAYQPALDKATKAEKAYNSWKNDVVPCIITYNSIPLAIAKKAYYNAILKPLVDQWSLAYGAMFTAVNYSNNGNDYLNYLSGEYEKYNKELANTPKEIIEYKCTLEHKLHSIGLYINSADDIMTALGFDDNYKAWYKLTVDGFKANPNLKEETT